MDKTIGMVELQNDFERIISEVAADKASFVLTHDDHPAAVIISYAEYLRLRRSREEIVTRFNRIWAEIGRRNAHFTDEEIEADIEAADQEWKARRRHDRRSG